MSKNFRREKRSGGGRDFGGRGDRGGNRDRGGMHDAVCDECGKKCQVPFRPTGDKPVYCSDCFELHGGREERGGRNERRSFGGGRDSSSGRGDRQMFSAICSECHNRCTIPFQPTGDKPVYCDMCFEKRKGGMHQQPKNTNDLKEKLNSLHAKLDKILSILENEKIGKIKSEHMIDELDIKEVEKEIKKEKTKKEPAKKEKKKATAKKKNR